MKLPIVAYKRQVLDLGFIRLEDSMGSDLNVVNSARVSFGKRKEEVDESDRKLINYLMRERHGTPFEHNAFMFHVKAPIFVFREWQRHRIGSFNEMSGRYTELTPEWYVPRIDNVRSRVGKPGNYTYERTPTWMAGEFCQRLEVACRKSFVEYQTALENGIAPEQARMFLHVNHYSEMYWTVNARSLMNFINLRTADNAQWEIREYADLVEQIFESKMPVTHAAFVRNGRVAP